MCSSSAWSLTSDYIDHTAQNADAHLFPVLQLSLSLSFFFLLSVVLLCFAARAANQTHLLLFLYLFFARHPNCACSANWSSRSNFFSFSILSKLQLRKTIDFWKWKHKSGVLARKKEENSRSAVAYKWSSADV